MSTSEHTTSLSRGATARGARPGLLASGLYVKALIAVVCSVALLLVVNYWSVLVVKIDRPVARVLVEGNFHFVDQTRIKDLVMAELTNQGDRGNFFALNLQQLQNHLQREIWVDIVQVSRRWPNILTVRVQEHKPIARWSQSGFLNLRGDVIVADLKPELLTLPLLEGEAGKEQDIMAQYQRLSNLLRSRELNIERLCLLPTGAWQMDLTQAEDPIQVTIGRDQVMDKIQRLLLVYDQELQQQRDRIDSIDLRYSNGIAVSWRNVTNNIENS